MKKFLKSSIVNILHIVIVLVVLSSLPIEKRTFAYEDYFSEISVIEGPSIVDIKRSSSTLTIPEEVKFISGANAKNLLEFYGINIATENTSLIMPKDEMMQMSIIYTFKPTGYIKKVEINEKNINELLAQISKKNVGRHDMASWVGPPAFIKDKNIFNGLSIVKSEQYSCLEGIAIIFGNHGYVMLNMVTHENDTKKSIEIFEKVRDSFVFKDGYKYSQFEKSQNVIESVDVLSVYKESSIDANRILSLFENNPLKKYLPEINESEANSKKTVETEIPAKAVQILFVIGAIMLILKAISRSINNKLKKNKDD